MIYCGTDIIEVNRIKQAIESNDKFKEKVFTINEINEIEKSSTKYERYAGRFAAKEAIYKAISKILVNRDMVIDFNEIEVINLEDYKRRPEVMFKNIEISGMIKSIDISISHIKEFAVANCVVEV
jgi:holo-[acyl-carrier protein] synthase